MKAETGSLLFARKSKIENALFFLTLLFAPTQLGRHFWPSFSYVLGIRTDYLSPTLYLTDILILVLFIFTIASFKPRFLPLLFKKFFWVSSSSLFLIFIIIGILLSKNPPAGLYGLLKLLEFIFFGVYTAHFVTKANFKKILFVFSVGIIFESILSAAQYLAQSSIGGFFYFFGERAFNGQTPGVANASINGDLILRCYGTFSHPNVLGGYLLIGMTLILFNLESTKKQLEKILYLISLSCGTLALMLTFSRIAILLWLIILLIFLISRAGKKILRKNIAFFLIFISIVIFFIFYTPIISRFSNFSLYDESFSQREDLLKNSLGIIKNHPFFGTGLNNFLIELAQVQKTNNVIFYLQPVHNIFLLVAAQTGILGLIYFIGFLAKTFKKAFWKGDLINYKIIIFFGVLILGSFDHYFLTIQQGQLLLSFILGLIWAKFKS